MVRSLVRWILLLGTGRSTLPLPAGDKVFANRAPIAFTKKTRNDVPEVFTEAIECSCLTAVLVSGFG